MGNMDIRICLVLISGTLYGIKLWFGSVEVWKCCFLVNFIKHNYVNWSTNTRTVERRLYHCIINALYWTWFNSPDTFIQLSFIVAVLMGSIKTNSSICVIFASFGVVDFKSVLRIPKWSMQNAYRWSNNVVQLVDSDVQFEDHCSRETLTWLRYEYQIPGQDSPTSSVHWFWNM